MIDRRSLIIGGAAIGALAALPALLGPRPRGWRILHRGEDGRVSLYAGVDGLCGAGCTTLTFCDDHRPEVRLLPGRLWIERATGTDWLGPLAS